MSRSVMSIRSLMTIVWLAFLLLSPWASEAQVHTGELHLKVIDPSGIGIKANIVLESAANQYNSRLTANDAGTADAMSLPYGSYLIRIETQGFSAVSVVVQIRSAIPVTQTVQLKLSPVATEVEVTAAALLIDPYRPSSTMQIGAAQIDDRVGSLPGRSVQDLINAQPGWLYEGNAVLHPRGSEYQTQFVVDGIPLTDNRSPSFGPEIEADDVSSMSIYTAGIPAEYGRKMGGVVEINTKRDATPGLHGQVILSGGTYATAGAFAQVQETFGRQTVGISSVGSRTSHYLNPVVPENYTNRGTTGDFSVRYERQLIANDTLTASVRHELSRYEVPNEYVQHAAGQVQNRDNFETMGTISYQHIFSADVLGTLAGMGRDNANNFYSNPLSTPLIAFQHNSFREGYLKGSLSAHHRNQEWKGGLESDATILHENFSDSITDPTQFGDGTPPSFAFNASRPDLEQSAFVEDLIRLGNWTASVGLRWDHYQLVLNQNAFSPRLSVARYLPVAKMVVHVSYDRVFQTPSSENILLSSSSAVASLSPNVLRLPVQPSKGNYYEGGLTKGISDTLRLDVNVFRRNVRSFADDDQLLNTGVSYPISFDRAVLYGAEGKLTLVQLAKLTGFVSYSYLVGNVWFPVTGGLFLGDDVASAKTQLAGHFPDSQDQRNTVQTRFQYQVLSRMWLATGLSYGSGLPFQYGGTYQEALSTYRPEVVSRINFSRGRILPSLAVNASVSVDLYTKDRRNLRLQVDGENLNDRLNVLDFGGLFSGNAIAPGRSWSARVKTSF